MNNELKEMIASKPHHSGFPISEIKAIINANELYIKEIIYDKKHFNIYEQPETGKSIEFKDTSYYCNSLKKNMIQIYVNNVFIKNSSNTNLYSRIINDVNELKSQAESTDIKTLNY